MGPNDSIFIRVEEIYVLLKNLDGSQLAVDACMFASEISNLHSGPCVVPPNPVSVCHEDAQPRQRYLPSQYLYLISMR